MERVGVGAISARVDQATLALLIQVGPTPVAGLFDLFGFLGHFLGRCMAPPSVGSRVILAARLMRLVRTGRWIPARLICPTFVLEITIDVTVAVTVTVAFAGTDGTGWFSVQPRIRVRVRLSG